MRDSFIARLESLAAVDPRVFLVTGDLGFGVLDKYASRFPRQFLNAGVAEQNMTGVATGLAFDRAENLYVGDREGTIFKVARDRQIFVFATLEPSISAYHLALGPKGDLFVTGPTTSSFDSVYKIDPQGAVSVLYRGLGRPQGLAFDIDGNLYVSASLAGKRGIVKITPDGKASLAVSGSGLVGLAFAPGRSAVLVTTNAVHHLAWDVQGQPVLDLA